MVALLEAAADWLALLLPDDAPEVAERWIAFLEAVGLVELVAALVELAHRTIA